MVLGGRTAAGRDLYAVTSERVVTVSGVFARRVKSLGIDTITDVTLTEWGDGSGTITFGPAPPYYWRYGGAGWPGFGHQAVPCFELGGEARQVYEVVRRARRAAKRHRTRHRTGPGGVIGSSNFKAASAVGRTGPLRVGPV